MEVCNNQSLLYLSITLSARK